MIFFFFFLCLSLRCRLRLRELNISGKENQLDDSEGGLKRLQSVFRGCALRSFSPRLKASRRYCSRDAMALCSLKIKFSVIHTDFSLLKHRSEGSSAPLLLSPRRQLPVSVFWITEGARWLQYTTLRLSFPYLPLLKLHFFVFLNAPPPPVYTHTHTHTSASIFFISTPLSVLALLCLSWHCRRAYTRLPKALLSSLCRAQIPMPDGCVSPASSPGEWRKCLS